MSNPTPEWIKDTLRKSQINAAERSIEDRVAVMIGQMQENGGKQTAQTAKVNYVTILARLTPDILQDWRALLKIFNTIDKYFEEQA